MRLALLGLAVLLRAGPGDAQSLMERSPNLHGAWTLPSGEAAFVFVHRFEFMNGGDELFNVPTLTLAAGVPLGLTVGLDFTSYSEVVPGRVTGNETQYWVKRSIWDGDAFRVAGLAAYNTAAGSWDGAVELQRGWGPATLSGEVRGFSDLFGSGEAGLAGGAGASLRLTEYLGVTGDVGRVLGHDSVPAAWSAGIAMAIPGSPHTMSFHASNSGAVTLQGASREKVVGRAGRLRYGFSFTVPLGTASRWARIFRPAPAPAQPPAGAAAEDSAAATVEMRMIAFAPGETHIEAGQSVRWVNRDPVPHTVTAGDQTWGSALLGEGAQYTRRFDEPGRYPYFCTPHPQMRGVIVVSAASGGDSDN